MTKTTVVKKYTLGLSAKHGFEEIVMRSPGRYEISLLNYYKNLNTTIAGCGYNSNSSTADYQKHYLVGLLHYPNDAIPEILNGVTSGTKDIPGGPYEYVPRYVADELTGSNIFFTR